MGMGEIVEKKEKIVKINSNIQSFVDKEKGVSFFFFFFFLLFRATLVAYEISQTRGPTGAAAASSLHHSHSNAESEPHL